MVLKTLYPLRFKPFFKNYIWGGRRLQTVLGKPLPEADIWAESWEICDHGNDQSVVQFGSLAGCTLGELVKRYGNELFGRHAPQQCFPLLLKFLDASQTLSVQVHPNDEQAAKLNPPDSGKTEALVVVAAEPGSLIYAGLQAGVTHDLLREAIYKGRCQECLHSFEPSPGDCVLIPAGVVHAYGAGLLLVELQQASDVTYRLFDWNRLGADGKPRQLHIEAGLAVTDFNRGPVFPQIPLPTDNPERWRLVACERFIIDKLNKIENTFIVGGDDRFHILVVLEGVIRVENDPADVPLVLGQTMLLPACLGPIKLMPHEKTTILDAYLP